MARRFYQPTGDVPAVSPAFDAAWTLTGSAVRRRMMTVVKTANDAVANGGAIASNASGDVVLHRQYVSDPMNAGLVFDTSTTYKCYLQALESAINDNAFPRMGVRIVSYDGSTVRATLLAVADYSTPTEFNTALRNKIFANGDTGTNASYTTQTGDRLVVELGHGDTAGATISVTLRWGTSGASSGDLPEDETTTTTTFRGWFETSTTVTFWEQADDFEVSPDNTTLNPGNIATTTATGTTVSDSGRTPAVGSFSAMFAAPAATTQLRYDHLAVSEAWWRFYVQMDTLAPANVDLILIRNGASNAGSMQINTAGNIRLRDQTLAQIDLSAATLAVDVWHRIELHMTTTRLECRYWSDPTHHGGPSSVVEDETTLGGTVSNTTWDNFAIGVVSATTWTIWLDALAVRFADGWVGSARPYSLSPRARHPMQAQLTR